MDGFFDLHTLDDLLRKLERDYVRLQQVPEDVDAAYNFFVTAENIPEWVKGGRRQGKAFKRRIQQQHLILTLCNELATGAKHFTTGKEKPTIAEGRYEGIYERGLYEPGIYEASLIVRLSPEQAAQRGEEVTDVLTLAGEVLAFWRRYLAGEPSSSTEAP